MLVACLGPVAPFDRKLEFLVELVALWMLFQEGRNACKFK